MRSETGFDHALYARFPTEKQPDADVEELRKIWAAPTGWSRCAQTGRSCSCQAKSWSSSRRRCTRASMSCCRSCTAFQAAVTAALCVKTTGRALRINGWALTFSTAYLAWSALAQAWVTQHARESLQALGLPSQQLLVTPAPFNTVLWRVVALDGERFHEGFYALMDGGRTIRFVAHERGGALATQNAEHPQLQRLARFTDGFFKVQGNSDKLVVTDLRMGQEPDYVFSFDIGPPLQAGATHPVAEQRSRRMDVGEGLKWLGQRMLGHDVPPPERR